MTQQPGGGPWTQQFNPTPGRYVRITLKDGLRDFRSKDQVEINLGEIELLEDGRLVSGGLPVLAPGAEARTTGLSLLTDGLVSERSILPLRQAIFDVPGNFFATIRCVMHPVPNPRAVVCIAARIGLPHAFKVTTANTKLDTGWCVVC